MKHFLFCMLALVALVATVRADDEKKPEPPKPDTFRSLTTEFSKARSKVAAEFRAAKTDAEREKILAEYNKIGPTFSDRFLAFAKQNADDASAMDALVWVVTNDGEGENANAAIPLLIEKHLDNPKIVRVCQQLSRSTSPGAKQLLQGVIDSSKNEDARGHASYSLAKAMIGRGGEKNEKAEALLASVVKDYAKVSGGSLAKMAERDLFEIQNLSIGCVAPNITAEDIDGVEFSLTDYRGKIVVLDFWGDW